jgi:hypothetical protein
MCVQSKGIISDQTIMEHHPWAAEDEDERLEAQEKRALEKAEEYQNAFAAKEDPDDEKNKNDEGNEGKVNGSDDNKNKGSGGGATR